MAPEPCPPPPPGQWAGPLKGARSWGGLWDPLYMVCSAGGPGGTPPPDSLTQGPPPSMLPIWGGGLTPPPPTVCVPDTLPLHPQGDTSCPWHLFQVVSGSPSHPPAMVSILGVLQDPPGSPHAPLHPPWYLVLGSLGAPPSPCYLVIGSSQDPLPIVAHPGGHWGGPLPQGPGEPLRPPAHDVHPWGGLGHHPLPVVLDPRGVWGP